MSKDLPYFKFKPADWLIGKISFQPLQVQGAFIQCCCLYWIKQNNLESDDVIYRIGEENLQNLVKLGFVELLENGTLQIAFLDEQLEAFDDLSEKRRAAGRKGGKAKKSKSQASEKQSEPIKKDKEEEEEEEEDKTEKTEGRKRFAPPSIIEISDFMLEKGVENYNAEAQKFFHYYESNGWKVGKNKMKSWKAAANGWISRLPDFVPSQKSNNNGTDKKRGEKLGLWGNFVTGNNP